MKRIILFSALIAIMSISISLTAQSKYLLNSHSIKIEGTSNVMSWEAEVPEVSGEFILQANGSGEIIDVEKVSVRIESTAIKGTEGRAMTEKIHEALNVQRYQYITFRLQEVQQVRSSSNNPDFFRMVSTGVLTISGVSKSISLTTVGRVNPGGDIVLTGTQDINMTDYEVKPPRAMFGALRTREEITVKYSISLTFDESLSGK